MCARRWTRSLRLIPRPIEMPLSAVPGRPSMTSTGAPSSSCFSITSCRLGGTGAGDRAQARTHGQVPRLSREEFGGAPVLCEGSTSERAVQSGSCRACPSQHGFKRSTVRPLPYTSLTSSYRQPDPPSVQEEAEVCSQVLDGRHAGGSDRVTGRSAFLWCEYPAGRMDSQQARRRCSAVGVRRFPVSRIDPSQEALSTHPSELAVTGTLLGAP